MDRPRQLLIASGVGALAIIIGLVVYSATRPMDTSTHYKKDKTARDLEEYSTLLKRFHADHQRFPRDEEGLSAALAISLRSQAKRGWRPLDPWGRHYMYHARDNRPPEVYSVGPNGIDEHGDGDDISMPEE